MVVSAEVIDRRLTKIRTLARRTESAARQGTDVPALSTGISMGAPKNNSNALQHGIRRFLATGKLPPGASYVRKVVDALRTELEAEVLSRHGEVGVEKALYISSAVRFETIAQLCLRYMRGAGLDDAGKLAYMKEVRAATAARDGVIKALGLSVTKGADPFASLAVIAKKVDEDGRE